MTYFPNAMTRAIERKQRKRFPPDQLANGVDTLLSPVVSTAYFDAMVIAWAPVPGNQWAPAVDPKTLQVEPGYWQQLPWDE